MNLSLPLFYFRRSLNQGKWYLILGISIPVAFTIAFYISNPGNMDFNGIFGAYPIIMPEIEVIASIPLISFFISDRRAGFYEYLFGATETGVRKLYLSIAASSICIATVPLAVISALAFGISAFTYPLSGSFIETFLVYSLPLSYITPLLTLTFGTTWVALTQPIRGTLGASPAGMVPFVGLLIVGIPLFVQNSLPASKIIPFLGAYTAVVFILLAGVMLVSFRTLTPERFLP